MNLVDYVNDELVAEEQYKEVLKTKGLEAATRRLLWLFDDVDRQFSLLYRFDLLQEVEEKWVQEDLPTDDVYEKLCLSLIQIGRQIDDLIQEVQQYSAKLMLNLPKETENRFLQAEGIQVTTPDRSHHGFYQTHRLSSSNLSEPSNIAFGEWMDEIVRQTRELTGSSDSFLIKRADFVTKTSYLVQLVDVNDTIHAYTAIIGGSHKVRLYSSNPITGEVLRHSNRIQLRNLKDIGVNNVAPYYNHAEW